MYKIEVPIPNYVHDTPRALSGYIDLVEKYRDHIDSLYFPLGHVDKGIDVWGIRAPDYVYDSSGEVNRNAVAAWELAIEQINEFAGLPVKILMNNTFNPSFHNEEHLKKIEKKLNYYSSRFNILSVTIADFTLIPFLKRLGYPISLSTNSHNSFAELDMAFNIYGIETFHDIVIQRDLNRNPQKLKSYLRKRGGEPLYEKSVLMVNEGCINGCPYKEAGDLEISTTDVTTKNNVIHKNGCTILSQGLPWTFLTSPFLTKQMMDEHYPDVRTIKLAGRNLPLSQLKKMMDHWVNGTEHKLKDVLNVFMDSAMTTHDLSEQYIRDVMTCNKECFVCKKCEGHYNDLFDRHPSIDTMMKIVNIKPV